MTLSWGLVIATYRREDILLRCLKCAATQSCPPKEIVVVDNSPYWDRTRAQVLNELGEQHPGIEWKYVQAEVGGAAAQRAQGTRIANADILFLIDDDSLMHPTCAESVLSVYAQDKQMEIVGIMPLLHNFPPDHASGGGENECDAVVPNKSRLRKHSRRRLHQLKQVIKGRFLPIEFAVQESDARPDLDCSWNEVPAIHGARMSFRREALMRHNFDSHMKYVHDETEMSLRIRREGKIICIHQPLIFHAEAPTHIVGRQSQAERAFWLVNHAYMCRKLMSDSHNMQRYVRRYGSRTRMLDLLTGVAARNLNRWRGAMNCRKDVEELLAASEHRYVAVYDQIIEKWRTRKDGT